jgi:hypothetical protein
MTSSGRGARPVGPLVLATMMPRLRCREAFGYGPQEYTARFVRNL